MQEARINIFNTPFSRYGAYLSVTAEDGRLVIHNSRLRFQEGPLFAVTAGRGGERAAWEVSASPWEGRLKADGGEASFYIRDDRTVVFRSRGLDLDFALISDGGYGMEYGPRTFRLIASAQRTYALFQVEKGAGRLSGPVEIQYGRKRIDRKRNLHVSCREGEILLALCFGNTEPRDIPLPLEPEKELAAVRAEWEEFLGKAEAAGCVPDEYAAESWYNLWSSFVRARDVYPYDAVLMSKKFMSSLWSWDHCFNALALSQIDGQAALEQFLIPFAHQDANGALPDLLNPNMEVLFTFTKPPIHGWCFSLLMDAHPYPADVLERVYGYLEKWTGWWLEFRDPDRDGIPDYPHGNDSGWDNSTLFDEGYFIESPDLPAFLILQMGCLARIAAKLGRPAAEKEWKEKAEDLKRKWYAHSWNGRRFAAKQSVSHQSSENPSSLLSLMPIVLGKELDADKMEKLADILEKDFLTPNGPATEALNSPDYQSDGYWRGPIWAPSTYLIADGLRRGGYRELAGRIARGFCNMVKNIARGNYENFDAVTGQGLCAPGYTWTASVYLLLEKEFPLP